MKRVFILLTLILITNSSCVEKSKNSNQNELVFMTYNVENLFDEIEQKNQDVSFLPLEYKKKNGIFKKCNKIRSRYYRKNCLTSDWNKQKVEAKLNNLADIIARANDDKGPDILLLQEVENLLILKRLKEKLLAKNISYNIAHIDSPDKRGIDTAILSKYKIERTELLINESLGVITRGILEVKIKVSKDQYLIAYSVHFPSQGKRTPKRIASLEFLFKHMQQRLLDNPQAVLVAAGDVNIIKHEEKEGIYNNVRRFAISHKVATNKYVGTYYYHPKKSWSYFDVFIFPKIYLSNNSKIQAMTNSITPFNITSWQNEKTKDGELTPRKYVSRKNGASDHWPLLMKINLK